MTKQEMMDKCKQTQARLWERAKEYERTYGKNAYVEALYQAAGCMAYAAKEIEDDMATDILEAPKKARE